MMTLPSLDAPEAALLPVLGPLMLAAMWWDLRRMRIPNWLTGATAALFAPFAFWALGADEVQARALGALAVLAACYAFFFFGRMGGGDAKLLAACALFVRPEDAAGALFLLAFWLGVGLAALMAARAALGGRARGWKALRRGAHFPMGVSIGAAMISYLILRARAPDVPAPFWLWG
ncbi:prepilin peptidase CpaA [Oceanicella actignis]|nr:prepilin peptidase CpaA [Oceanicella actignis]